MRVRSGLLLCASFACWASGAAALQLDTLLPQGVPGFGTAAGISVTNRVWPDDQPRAIELGGIEVDPELEAGGGYDNAPNGAAPASAVLDLNPSVLIQDAALGLGAYAAGQVRNYPENSKQDQNSYTFALGEQAVLARQTITAGAAYVQAVETGFGLNTLALTQPVAFSVQELRGNDRLEMGMFNLTPELSVNRDVFNGLPGQNRTDYRQGLTTEFAPGGPVQVVNLLHAVESRFADAGYNADSYEALAGIADDAPALWMFRLLGGAAWREAAMGKAVLAPVLEGSADWLPDELDSLSLALAHEIDDPDQVSAAGYMLTEADVSWDHEYLRDLVLSGKIQVQRAAYFHTTLDETLLATDARAKWRLNRALSLTADYAYNDRQANFLRAANEHVVTMAVTWTP